MREIKFRVWDNHQKEMREVAMLRWEDGRLSRIAGYWKGTRNNGWTDYDPADGKYELMQYTGLKDKNGKEIYEGNIVNHLRSDGTIYHGPLEVVQRYGRWFPLVTTSRGMINVYDHNNFEVIGSIYEDPELIV